MDEQTMGKEWYEGFEINDTTIVLLLEDLYCIDL